MYRNLIASLWLLFTAAESLEIVCGGFHNCVFERGTKAMKCFGLNANGQLGLSDHNDNRGDDVDEMGENLPFVEIDTNFNIEQVALGRDHSCVMSNEGAMKCFGDNANSQLGFIGSTTTGNDLPFVDFGDGTNLSNIAAGTALTCALSTDAVLKCFGYNPYGQCGAGTSATPIGGPPRAISAIRLGTNFTPIDMRASYYHVCVTSLQGTLKCFGYNEYGQLGYGDTSNRGSTPQSMGDGLPILDLGSNFVVQTIATGVWHTCALSAAKTVKCWGDNRDGQCGTLHSGEVGDNLPVLDLGAEFVPMQLALGAYHTCILSETATIKCFGENFYGQLGIGSTARSVHLTNTLTPIDLGSDFEPRQIAAGFGHTCALSTSDRIKCWGRNNYGLLGLGHTNQMGDEPNEMGDNLPYVDTGSLAQPPTQQPTAAPTTAAPSTTRPSTTRPSTSAPYTSAPSTTAPSTTRPSTAPPSTAAPTQQPTASRPSTVAPSTVRPTTTAPTAPAPTVTQPTNSPTIQPTNSASTTAHPISTIYNNYNYTVSIKSVSLSASQILVAVANAFNLGYTELATVSTDDDSVFVQFLLVLPSHAPLDSDVIEDMLREAMVDEYGDDIEVEITVGEAEETTQHPHETAGAIETTRQPDHDDDATVTETESHSLRWLIIVACSATVCCCCVAVAIVRCVELVRKRNRAENRQQPGRIEFAALPVHAAPNVQALRSESDVESEERKEDMHAAHAFANQIQPPLQVQPSNRPEGLPRAPIIAQPTEGGLPADVYANTTSNVLELNLEEDEFEVVDDSVFHFRNSVFH